MYRLLIIFHDAHIQKFLFFSFLAPQTFKILIFQNLLVKKFSISHKSFYSLEIQTIYSVFPGLLLVIKNNYIFSYGSGVIVKIVKVSWNRWAFQYIPTKYIFLNSRLTRKYTRIGYWTRDQYITYYFEYFYWCTYHYCGIYLREKLEYVFTELKRANLG